MIGWPIRQSVLLFYNRPDFKEIAPGLYKWSKFSTEKQISFNGYYLVYNGESVIIDPPILLDDELQLLKNLIEKNSNSPLKAILLTNVHHDRMSQKIKEIFGVPVYIHENDASELDFEADHTFVNYDELFCGLKVIHLKNQKSPGESAFYLKGQKKNICRGCIDRENPREVEFTSIRKICRH